MRRLADHRDPFPALACVAQPLEEVGQQCVRLLLARIAAPDAAPERLLLEPSLVVRDSVCAPGGDAPETDLVK
ncbi:substrate-binding domain-containing protein [Streptomyces sp. NPDC013161]|uniref:substrate-binding domain-containing protein n=1 Tax=Streptomyces sp. NPDC013161 TaxID=3364862 RepID=UPI00369DD1DD